VGCGGVEVDRAILVHLSGNGGKHALPVGLHVGVIMPDVRAVVL
jgi:hypothetical protein